MENKKLTWVQMINWLQQGQCELCGGNLERIKINDNKHILACRQCPLAYAEELYEQHCRMMIGNKEVN